MAVNPLKQAIRNGTTTIGVSITINSSRAVAVLSHTKFDWVWIDLEHGLLNLETAYELVQATTGTNCVPIIRIPGNEDWLIKQSLDLGAFGIVVPMVRGAEDVARAVSASNYPPRGIRGVSSGYAMYRWGINASEYWKGCDEELVRIIQVEDLQAVEHIDEIMMAPGIDLVFIGTSDLAAALGCIGEPNHSKVEGQIQKVLESGLRHKVRLGIVATNAQEINRRADQGFSFFLAGSDAAMMVRGTTQTLEGVSPRI